jgi:thiamine-phosphate pyrophosphorylase
LGSKIAPQVYIITDRHATNGRPLGDVVREALRGADDFRGKNGRIPVAVQLREKDLLGGPLLELARSLGEIARTAGAAFFVNDRLDVALAAAADGVHLPANGFGGARARQIAPTLRVAVSTHSAADVRAARDAGADFVVFGPIFDTPSKRRFGDPLGIETLRTVTGLGIPVLALGGVDSSSARVCLKTGSAGLAGIRNILSAKEPALAVNTFLTCVEATKNECVPR